MIQGYIKGVMEAAYPQLIWTEDNYVEQDNTGTVYKEGGEKPDTYESGIRFPYYMIWVRSSDFDLAQKVSEGSINALNKTHAVEWTDHNGQTYEIIFIEAIGDANRIGKNGEVMEWSSNFKVTLRRKTQ